MEGGLPPAHVGGAEVQAWELARRLARSHEVTVFTRRFDGLPAHEVLEDVRIVRTPFWPQPFSLVSHVAASVGTIRRYAPDLDALLCFRATPGGVIGALVKHLTGLPFCVSIRGGDWYFVAPHAWGRLLLRGVFAASSAVVVQAPRIRDEVQAGFPSVRPVVVPNGVEPDARTAHGDAVLFVGNLIARKGVPVLIEALRRLPGVRLVIAGDGPERPRLEELARGLDVEFAGALPPEQVRDLMVERGRLLVLPAVAGEGFPNVLLEAMSVGLPVVASDVAGVADLLQGGEAGALVPASDATALAAAVERLWSDADARARLGRAGKTASEQYAWSRVVPRIESLLEHLV